MSGMFGMTVMRRPMGLLVLLACLSMGIPAQAEGFQVDYHADPCRNLAERASGETRRVGDVSVSLETFYYAACERVRLRMVEGLRTRATNLASQLPVASGHQVTVIYDRFVEWLSQQVHSRLPPERRDETTPREALKTWLANPDQDVTDYVNHYLATKAPQFVEALKRVQQDSSLKIIEGLQTLWQEAKQRLQALIDATAALEEAPPDTAYTDKLREFGLSGEWIDRLQAYEAQFDLLDRNYNVADAARTMYRAFTAEAYAGQLKEALTLLEIFGGTLESSRVPAISLVGTLVANMGKLGKEAVARANALSQLIRAREGYCIGLGYHTLLEERSIALKQSAGEGIGACPLDRDDPLLKDMYYQAEPHNRDQLYFWVDGGFVTGRATGGGRDGVADARAFIRSAAGIGFSAFVGKADDMETIIDVYNTPYGPEHYLADVPGHSPEPGITGLTAEADAVMNAIVERVRKLRKFLELDDSCGPESFERLIARETGLRLGAFPMADRLALQKLKTSYALGFIQLHRGGSGNAFRTEAYTRYRDVWKRLKDLSLVRLDVRVRDKKNIAKDCPDCAGARIELNVENGREMAGCRVTAADDRGLFTARIVTRSPDVAITASAQAGDVSSEPETVDKRHLEIETLPFRKAFDFTLRLPFEAQTTPEEILAALRSLHGKATRIAQSGRTACAAARRAIADIKAARRALDERIASFEQEMAQRNDDLAALAKAGGRLTRLAERARTQAEAAVEAKQKAEEAALTACDKVSAVRDASDEARQQRLLTEIRSARTQARMSARRALRSEDAARKTATKAGKIANTAEPIADKAATLSDRAQSLTSQAEEIRKQGKSIDQYGETIKAALQKLDELLTQVDPAHTAALATASALADPSPVRAEATRLRNAIRALPGDLRACLDEIADAEPGAGAEGLSDRLEKATARLRALPATTGQMARAQVLRQRADTAAARADVAEIYAEAAVSAAEDARRCTELAASAITQGQEDDVAAAIRAAIAECRFRSAGELLQELKGDPRYAGLRETYRAAVDREARTRTAYERAQRLYRDGNEDAALAALETARAATECDRFRTTIDAAIARIKEPGGEPGSADRLAGQARAAIAGCQFGRAKDLIARLGEAGHAMHAALRAEYEAAVKRESRTRALYEKARERHRAGELDTARALLQQAQENTECPGFSSRIARTMAALDATPSADLPEDETGQAPAPLAQTEDDQRGLAQAWHGKIRLTRLTINGRAVSAETLIRRLARALNIQEQRRRDQRGDGPMEKTISSIVRALLVGQAVALKVMEEPTPVSFRFAGLDTGYKLRAVGAVSEKTREIIARMPAFRADTGQDTVSAVFREDDGESRITMKISPEENHTRLGLLAQMEVIPKADGPLRNVAREIRATFTGEATPGQVATKTVLDRFQKRWRRTMKGYADELGVRDGRQR